MSDKYENTVMAAELDGVQEKFRNLLDDNQKLNDNLKFAITQYNEVVEQNKSLQAEIGGYREALIAISNNEDCCCSLDDTCQPMRIAANILVGTNKQQCKERRRRRSCNEQKKFLVLRER